MHYAVDAWMARNSPDCPFERYADDAIVHCTARRQAEYVLGRIAARMSKVGLRLHPDKRRIVDCKDGQRRVQHEYTSFTYLGYAFRARGARSKGRNFTRVLARNQPRGAQGQERRAPSDADPHRRRDLSLDDLARWLNPIVAGWINYYARFYRSALNPLLRRVTAYLRRWAGRKYERLRTQKRYGHWQAGLLTRQPGLFTHLRTERSH